MLKVNHIPELKTVALAPHLKSLNLYSSFVEIVKNLVESNRTKHCPKLVRNTVCKTMTRQQQQQLVCHLNQIDLLVLCTVPRVDPQLKQGQTAHRSQEIVRKSESQKDRKSKKQKVRKTERQKVKQSEIQTMIFFSQAVIYVSE